MRVRKPLFIARQSAAPKGLLGSLIANIMARETANENDVAIDLIQVSTDAMILDAGTGHGRTMTGLLDLVPRGKVIGADISKSALAIAARRLEAPIRDGRAELHHCPMQLLPVADQSVDAILTVHTLYFIDDLQTVLAEFRRVLKQDGRVLLVFRPDGAEIDRDNFPAPVFQFRSAETIRNQAVAAGLQQTAFELKSCGGRIVAFMQLEAADQP